MQFFQNTIGMPEARTVENKIAKSGLITLDMAKYLDEDKIRMIDLKEYLFKGLILREKDFRAALKETDWPQYKGKIVGIYCSTNAIIPQWAYMLVTTYLANLAEEVIFGDKEAVELQWVKNALDAIDYEQMKDERVIIKGCGDKTVPPAAYGEITKRLLPVAKTIMYGEPCSTVPIFKKSKK